MLSIQGINYFINFFDLDLYENFKTNCISKIRAFS